MEVGTDLDRSDMGEREETAHLQWSLPCHSNLRTKNKTGWSRRRCCKLLSSPSPHSLFSSSWLDLFFLILIGLRVGCVLAVDSCWLCPYSWPVSVVVSRLYSFGLLSEEVRDHCFPYRKFCNFFFFLNADNSCLYAKGWNKAYMPFTS